MNKSKIEKELALKIVKLLSALEVEGKPVFLGDKLYDWKGDAHTIPYLNDGTKMDLRKGCEWTWTPPKPKTVTVDLPYDYVFIHSELNLDTTLVTACKKALEELK